MDDIDKNNFTNNKLISIILEKESYGYFINSNINFVKWLIEKSFININKYGIVIIIPIIKQISLKLNKKLNIIIEPIL